MNYYKDPLYPYYPYRNEFGDLGGYYWMLRDLYEIDPFFQKGIETPVSDALVKGWGYEGLDKDQSKALNKYLESINFIRILQECLISESLYGGSGMLVYTEGKSLRDPLLENDSINRLVAVGRQDVVSVYLPTISIETVDLEVEYFNVSGLEVHYSRLLLFRGKPTPISSYTQEFTGFRDMGLFSVPHSIKMLHLTLDAAKVRVNTVEVAERNSIYVYKDDYSNNDTNDAVAAQQEAAATLQRIKNTRMLKISKQGDLSSVNNGGFADFINLQQADIKKLAAGWDIPLSRFGADNASTFQNSGRSDITNWYDKVRAIQEMHIRPLITKIINHIARQINITDEFEIVFNILYAPSEVEQSQIDSTYTNMLVNFVNSGVISTDEARLEAGARGLLTVTDVESPSPDLSYTDQDLASQQEARELFDDSINQLKGLDGATTEE